MPKPSRKHRPSRPTRANWKERIALSCFSVTVVLAPQLLGGALDSTVVVISLLSACSAFTAWWACQHEERAQLAAPIGILVFAAGVWTIVQRLPLPCSWIAPFSARTVAETTATVLLLSNEAPTFCTLTMDPGRTTRAALQMFSLAATFSAAFMLSSNGRRRFVYYSIAGSCVAMACVALAHQLVGATEIFGLYHPRYGQPRFLSPLVNENHLAGLLSMGCPLVVACALEQRRSSPRWIIWIAAVLVGTTTLLTLSRGGIASLVLGLVLFAWFAMTRKRARRQKTALFWIGATAAAVLALALYSSASVLEQELTRREFSKAELLEKALWFALHAPWMGVGRGAFSPAFVAHYGTSYRFEYAENIVAQWVSEWGLPFAALCFVMLGRALSRRVRRADSLTDVAAATALLTIAAHDLVDFSLELLGVGTVAIALLGAVVFPRTSRKVSQIEDKSAIARHSWVRHFRLPMTRLSLWSAGITFALVLGPGLTLEAQNAKMQEQMLVHLLSTGNRSEFAKVLRRALELHPMEPTFPLLAGTEARQHGDAAALRFLTRAMQLAPQWPGPHVQAALWLLARQREPQALLEIREAARFDPESASYVMCSHLRDRADGHLAALKAAPWGKQRIAFLDRTASCLPPKSVAAERIDLYLIRAAPNLVGPRLRQAERLVTRGENRRAEAQLRYVLRYYPDNMDAVSTLGRVYLGTKQYRRALKLALEMERRHEVHPSLIGLRARAEAGLGLDKEMRETLEELRGLAMGSPEALSAAAQLLGELELSRGNLGRSLNAYEEAYRFAPSAGVLTRVAQLAEQFGAIRRAHQAYAELCDAEPSGSVDFCREKNRLAARLAGN